MDKKVTFRREPKVNKKYLKEMKRSEKRNEELGKAKLTNSRSYSAYRERLEVNRNIKSGAYTSYSAAPKMTKEEFLKSIS